MRDLGEQGFRKKRPRPYLRPAADRVLLAVGETHRPDAHRVRNRCQVDCSCGWRGPVVSTFGAGYLAWRAHDAAVTAGGGG